MGWQQRGKPIRRPNDSSYCVSWSHDDRLLGTAGADGRFLVFDRTSKLLTECNLNPPKEVVPLTSFAFTPQKNIIVASQSNGMIVKHNIQDNKTVHSFAEPNETYVLAASVDGATFASAGQDGSVRVYDSHSSRQTPLHTFTTKDKFDVMNHPSRLYALRYDRASPQIIASGGWQSVKFWDLRVGGGDGDTASKPAKEITGPYLTGNAMDFGGDHTLFTASHRMTDQFEVYDTRTTAKVETIANPRDPSGIFPFLPSFIKCSRGKGTTIALGGGGEGVGTVNTAWVLDVKQGKVVGEVEGAAHGFHCCSFNKDDSSVVFGEAGGALHILDKK